MQRSSDAIFGAPRVTFSIDMRRIRWMNAMLIGGRPGLAFDFRFQLIDLRILLLSPQFDRFAGPFDGGFEVAGFGIAGTQRAENMRHFVFC